MFTFNKFILSWIFLIWTLPVTAQDMALNLGDKFFKFGNYYDAITEYKRYIFFNSEKKDDSISYAYYKIGLAFRNQGAWEEALSELRISIQTAKTERVRDERKIELAVVQIASGNYSAAEFLLIKLEMFSQIPELKQKAAFFRGIALLYSFKWKQANEAFYMYSNNLKDASKGISKHVESLLSNAQNMKHKSPKLAKMLSTVLPGSGQFYAGDWWNGINALLINAATGYLLVNDILKRQYQDAIFNSLFLFGRFYSGNRYHAEEAAKKYNRKVNQKIAASILKTLQREYNEKHKNN